MFRRKEFILFLLLLLIPGAASRDPARAAASVKGGMTGPDSYEFSFVPSTDDGDGQDWVAVVCFNADGTVYDVDISVWPVSDEQVSTGEFDSFCDAFFEPEKLPLTAIFCDTTQPFTGTENEQDGLDYVKAAGCDKLPSAAPGGRAFSGPPLPPPGGRNLVLLIGTTPVLSEPAGTAIGQILKTCQTTFIIETSKDGRYGRLYVMGGWIDLHAVADVAEDYGQPGGQPIAPQCVGK